MEIHLCSKVVSAEHGPKFRSHLQAMVTLNIIENRVIYVYILANSPDFVGLQPIFRPLTRLGFFKDPADHIPGPSFTESFAHL
jgi:hypothetical protein